MKLALILSVCLNLAFGAYILWPRPAPATDLRQHLDTAQTSLARMAAHLDSTQQQLDGMAALSALNHGRAVQWERRWADADARLRRELARTDSLSADLEGDIARWDSAAAKSLQRKNGN